MLRWRAVVLVRRVLDRYSAAGGGLLAGGLAYAALFALVPGVLLLTAAMGALVADPERRATVIDVIVGVLPPLKGLVDVILTEAAASAGPVSAVSLVVLVWGASRFVVAFEEALARVTGGSRRRGMLTTNVAAIVAVLVMIAAIFAGTVLAGVAAFLDAATSIGTIRIVGGALSVTLSLVPIAGTILAVVLVYRFVPLPAPPWRAILVPAPIVGLLLVGFVRVFVFVAPRLLGSAALLGTLATVFAALVWLSLSFQALLIGAAWVRERATPPPEPVVAPHPRATPG